MEQKTHRNSLKPGHKIHWYEIKEILGQGKAISVLSQMA